MNNKAIIPTSAILVFSTITLSNIQKDHRLMNSKEWLGFAIVFTMLSAGADLNIPIAPGMAMLVLVITLLTRGPEALSFMQVKLTQKQKAKGGRKSALSGESLEALEGE